MTGDGEAWVGDLLAFWFGELTPQQWFKRSDAVDGEIVRRFLATHELVAHAATTGLADAVMAAPRTVLACVIALDQLPRNLFRQSARAFATDAAALELARAAVVHGLDAGMTPHERLFLYLPFEHSERLADQAEAVRLISALGDGELTRFALRHHEIIARFGRFPHRNAQLGRPSTAAELAFLQEPDSGF